MTDNNFKRKEKIKNFVIRKYNRISSRRMEGNNSPWSRD